MTTIKKLLIIFSIACSCISCEFVPKSNSASEKDRVPGNYLQFCMNKQILPAADRYQKDCQELLKQSELYLDKANNEQALKEAYNQAFISLQYCIIYDNPLLGIGNKTGLYEAAGTSLLNHTGFNDLLKKTEAADYSYKDFYKDCDPQNPLYSLRADAYAAMDYMLFSGKVDMSVPAHRRFLNYMIKRQLSFAKIFFDYWNENSNDFVDQTNISVAGSGFSKLINNFLWGFEANIRQVKLGNPLGIYKNINASSDQQVRPQALEAYYQKNDISTKLLFSAIQSSTALYLGIPYDSLRLLDSSKPLLPKQGADSINSLKIVMKDIIASKPNIMNKGLYKETNNCFNSLYSNIYALQGKSLQSYLENPAGIQRLRVAYDSVQDVVKEFKSKIIASLGMIATYEDGAEGD